MKVVLLDFHTEMCRTSCPNAPANTVFVAFVLVLVTPCAQVSLVDVDAFFPQADSVMLMLHNTVATCDAIDTLKIESTVPGPARLKFSGLGSGQVSDELTTGGVSTTH